MNRLPKISVMMAAFNAAKYIQLSIESVLKQTYGDWELIIVNDGSKDDTKSIATSFADHRIRYFENERNMGLAYTRNRLLQLARGQYLAVLDSDDLARPERLEVESNFLNAHPDVGMVGGGIRMIDGNGAYTGVKWVFHDPCHRIPIILMFNNYFAHSTVMMRREAIPSEGYRVEYPPAEDYDLWIRISQRWRVCNLRKVLADYRVHDTNTSLSNLSRQAEAERRIFCDNLDTNFTGVFIPTEKELLFKLSHGRLGRDEAVASFSDIFQLLKRLWTARLMLSRTYRDGDFAIALLTLFYMLLKHTKSRRSRPILRLFFTRICTLRHRLFFCYWVIWRKFNYFWLN